MLTILPSVQNILFIDESSIKHFTMSTRHIYRLLIKRTLPRPASHSIIYWETMKYIKAQKGESKKLFEKQYHPAYRRYKCYRMFLRLREWKMPAKAGRVVQSQYAKKP